MRISFFITLLLAWVSSISQIIELSTGVQKFNIKKKIEEVEPKKRSNEKDNTPPLIKLTSPSQMRGAQISTSEAFIEISGFILDLNKIASVTINNTPLALDKNNEFKYSYPISDSTTITIRASDIYGNSADTSLFISFNGVNEKVGSYKALLIAINDYEDDKFQDLNKPIKDAESLKALLQERYGFEASNISLLRNPTRSTILSKLYDLRSSINSNDNLLIFYAGHGYYDDEMKNGYWLPSDANKGNPANWISNTDLTNSLSVIKSKHTLLISDACFSGGIFISRSALPDELSVTKLYNLASRRAITSGMLTSVPDESVFMQYLLKNLEHNTAPYLTAQDLFSQIRLPIMNNSKDKNVTPQYGTIQNVGDEGGDFIFKLSEQK